MNARNDIASIEDRILRIDGRSTIQDAVRAVREKIEALAAENETEAERLMGLLSAKAAQHSAAIKTEKGREEHAARETVRPYAERARREFVLSFAHEVPLEIRKNPAFAIMVAELQGLAGLAQLNLDRLACKNDPEIRSAVLRFWASTTKTVHAARADDWTRTPVILRRYRRWGKDDQDIVLRTLYALLGGGASQEQLSGVLRRAYRYGVSPVVASDARKVTQGWVWDGPRTQAKPWLGDDARARHIDDAAGEEGG